MARPRLLLLDEPMAGVNPALVDQIGEHIVTLKAGNGITVLMVEHNLGVVERICDHVIVMAEGRTLATGRMSRAAREHRGRPRLSGRRRSMPVLTAEGSPPGTAGSPIIRDVSLTAEAGDDHDHRRTRTAPASPPSPRRCAGC